MTTISISEARRHCADLANRVSLRGERVLVKRRGKKLFAVVSVEDVELLERLEDERDQHAVRAAQNEPTKPWPEVKKAVAL